jgi:phage/plasmid-associated DNA primase
MESKDEHSQAYDSDTSDSEFDEISEDYCDPDTRNDMLIKAQETRSKEYNDLMRLLITHVNEKGQEDTNIVDCRKKQPYKIPPGEIRRFFRKLENCRRTNLKLMFYEKQLEHSGIVLDFDIYQDIRNSQINDDLLSNLVINIVKKVISIVLVPIPIMLYVGVTKKPKIVYDDEKKIYKDGFHILLPNIKIKRPMKRLLIHEITNGDFLENIFRDNLKLNESQNINDILDKNSAHFPVFFIGNSSKIGSPPYNLKKIYEINIMDKQNPDNMIFRNVDHLINDPNLNLCHEFSLNWEHEKETSIIRKIECKIRQEYKEILNTFESSRSILFQAVDENDDIFEEDFIKNEDDNELAILKSAYPEAKYIISLIDLLDPKRADDYEIWFKILCALSNTSSLYKPIGEYFSKKSSKFSQDEFNRKWDDISRRRGQITLGTLAYFAKLDSPIKYKNLRRDNILSFIIKEIYDPKLCGLLQHYDIASILHKNLVYKYIYDSDESRWYEFILEDDRRVDGEIYKWRKYRTGSAPPNSLQIYICEELTKLFTNIHATLEKEADKNDGTPLCEYSKQVLKNFRTTYKNIKNHHFMNSCIKMSEIKFDERGFGNRLDCNDFVMGVGNGVLLLEGIPRLIREQNEYFVSQYTDVNYRPFNPYDPFTKRVLVALHNLFPDDEGDAFNFIMHYLASALDGRPKESMFLLIIGRGKNGKSTLTELFYSILGGIRNGYGVKFPFAWLTSQSNTSDVPAPTLLTMKKKRFVYYSESQLGEKLNMTKVKEFTGVETMTGRGMYCKDLESFRPRCHHMACSNNDPTIIESDYGTWRRIKYHQMKITFIRKETYTGKNKYERIDDPDIIYSWPSDPRILTAFLSILVYYYISLMKNYGGKVENVPHPTIRKATEEYKGRQDKISQFINLFVVKTREDFEFDFRCVLTKFTEWFQSVNPGQKIRGNWIVDELKNSKLQKFIMKNRFGKDILKGCRILDTEEEKKEDETFLRQCRENESDEKGEDVNVSDLINETAEEFYGRICGQYEQEKELFEEKDQKDIEYNNEEGENDEDNSDNEGSPLDELVASVNNEYEYCPRIDNIEIAGNKKSNEDDSDEGYLQYRRDSFSFIEIPEPLHTD